MKVAIIDYGAGNIKSIQFALHRLGINAFLTANPKRIQQADRVIFPGVGEASSAMKSLQKVGIIDLLPQLQQPVLGICLGMQLLCEFSEEGNTKGLGVFKVPVKRFEGKLNVPHVGWNTIENFSSSLFKGISEKEYMYFTHSFYAVLGNNTCAKTNYGIPFSAALQHNNFYGVQFHPEKSGTAGAQLLTNFINNT